jgi:hypothetical protein
MELESNLKNKSGMASMPLIIMLFIIISAYLSLSKLVWQIGNQNSILTKSISKNNLLTEQSLSYITNISLKDKIYLQTSTTNIGKISKLKLNSLSQNSVLTFTEIHNYQFNWSRFENLIKIDNHLSYPETKLDHILISNNSYFNSLTTNINELAFEQLDGFSILVSLGELKVKNFLVSKLNDKNILYELVVLTLGDSSFEKIIINPNFSKISFYSELGKINLPANLIYDSCDCSISNKKNCFIINKTSLNFGQIKNCKINIPDYFNERTEILGNDFEE